MKKEKTNITSEMIDTVTSYADGIFRVMRETGKTKAELKELFLDKNIEECPHCQVWCESSELISDESDEPDGYCNNCRRYK